MSGSTNWEIRNNIINSMLLNNTKKGFFKTIYFKVLSKWYLSIYLWSTLPSQIVNASNPKIFWQLIRAYLIQLQSNNTPFLYY